MIRLDLDLIRHALTTASERGYTCVEMGLGDDHFEAKLLPRAPSQKSKVSASEAESNKMKTITASAVGYYRSAKKALTPGSSVHAGDVVAEIVALGLVNEVTSKYSGRVVEVLVENDQPVEYGQRIARVDVEDV